MGKSKNIYPEDAGKYPEDAGEISTFAFELQWMVTDLLVIMGFGLNVKGV